ncbi:MAG TPA: alkaline phosphatase, partial [Rubricoccaceae bacterium]
LATGLVATSRITHATPASYASHVASRADEAEIAVQMAEARVDVMIGGGGRFFAPEAAGGSRADGRDLFRELLGRGVVVTTTRAGFDGLREAPAVALLAPDHMAYEIDRDETDEPSLAEMTRKALDLLAASPAGRDRGFFLMVEGSRIDHAGHGNDAPAHVRDILAYDAAVAAVLDWARRDGNTLVVSTADHETGGLTLGRDNVYAWDPAPLLAATMSAERLAGRFAEAGDTGGATREALIREALGDDSLAADVDARLQQALLLGPAPTPPVTAAASVDVFREVVDRRAGVAWTTGGHTAVDVGLYASGPGADLFRGQMTNDAVGRAAFAALGLAVPAEAAPGAP